MPLRSSFFARPKRRQEDQAHKYRDVTGLFIEPCEALSELQVLQGQISDDWDETPREKELRRRI